MTAAPTLTSGVLATLICGGAAAQEITGVWQTEPRKNGAFLSVEITGCPGNPQSRCGTVIDTHGSARPELMGEVLVHDLLPTADGSWSDGRIVNPNTGKDYFTKVRLLDAHRLEVTGCLGRNLLCKRQRWTRG